MSSTARRAVSLPRAAFEPHLAARGRGAQRVLDEPVEQLPHPPRVAACRQRPVESCSPEGDAERLRPGLPSGDGAAREVAEVDRADPEGEVVGLEPRELEQVGGEALEAGRLGDEHAADLRRPLGRDEPVGERLAVPAERRQRRAELVRDGQQELPLPSLARDERRVERAEGERDVRDLRGGGVRDVHPSLAVREPSRRRRRGGEGPGDAAGEPHGGGDGEQQGDAEGEEDAAREAGRVGGERGDTGRASTMAPPSAVGRASTRTSRPAALTLPETAVPATAVAASARVLATIGVPRAVDATSAPSGP